MSDQSMRRFSQYTDDNDTEMNALVAEINELQNLSVVTFNSLKHTNEDQPDKDPNVRATNIEKFAKEYADFLIKESIRQMVVDGGTNTEIYKTLINTVNNLRAYVDEGTFTQEEFDRIVALVSSEAKRELSISADVE